MELIYVPLSLRPASLGDRWHLVRRGADVALCGAMGAVVAPAGIAALDAPRVCVACCGAMETKEGGE